MPEVTKQELDALEKKTVKIETAVRKGSAPTARDVAQSMRNNIKKFKRRRDSDKQELLKEIHDKEERIDELEHQVQEFEEKPGNVEPLNYPPGEDKPAEESDSPLLGGGEDDG